MSIFNVLSLVGGISLFLYGMHVMGEALAKTAGGKLESILERLTNTVLKGVFLGAIVTAIIQASAATTVMVVGFVNSGIMNLNQAVGIIMGANIGTTITSWILSLSGIEGSSIAVQLLKPTSWTPILALIGIVLLMFTKKQKNHDVGQIFLGFAVLMFGMSTMTTSVAPLSNVPEFTNLLIKFRNPLLGLLAGLLLTAIIQSSSASVGILQALCATGAVTYSVAFPIIMGQNIGTCVTTLISAIGAKKNAKRAAFIHLYFNVVGTVVFMIGFYAINALVGFSFFNDRANAFGIALTHSCFNIITTLVWIPFNKLLVKLATASVKGQDLDDESQYTKELNMLDERFFERPTFAVAQVVKVANRMAELSKECLVLAGEVLIGKYNREKIDQVIGIERSIDKYEDKLGSYLVQLSSKSLNQQDSETLSQIFECIGSFERISDHARNIVELKEVMNEKELQFTDKANSEIEKYVTAVSDIVTMTVDAYVAKDEAKLHEIEAFEEAIDNIYRKAKKHHIKRLQKGKCAIANSVIIEDLYINLERIADHCSNVAATMIQVNEDDALENHVYVNALKAGEATDFKAAVKEYTKKYSL
jgi:phosphate:Na+ symporter